jgi:DNA repair exonuclease SbcCD nuclease subunit
MNFLYFTDFHGRVTAPRSRTDDYQAALLRKLDEIDRIRQERKVHFMWFGGDLFDTVNPPLGLWVKMATRMRNWELYGNCGSHDYQGYQLATIPETGVGYLEQWGIFHVLDRVGQDFEEGDTRVRVVGIPHLDGLTAEDLSVKKGEEDYLVELVHGDIVLNPVPWPHILISDIHTEADLVLIGHYHHGFDPVKIGNTVFAHPGSVARTEIGEWDVEPAVYFISAESDPPLWPEKIKLQDVTPSSEVFRAVESESGQEVSLEEFIESIQKLKQTNTGATLRDVVRTVGVRFPQPAVNCVLQKIEAHQEER